VGQRHVLGLDDDRETLLGFPNERLDDRFPFAWMDRQRVVRPVDITPEQRGVIPY
jgi:hypothetical protein